MGQIISLHRRLTPVVGQGRAFRLAIRHRVGWLLQRVGLPGFIRPFTLRDPSTGSMISLRTSERYTVLSVDGRDYYFDRETGALDGTGSSAHACCV